MSEGRPSPVRVLMVAIGGYGYYYLQTLLDQVPPDVARLAGVVDPEAASSRAWPAVKALEVPVCGEVGDFFQAGHRADLAVVVSPIHWHVPQSEAALASGADVLCDKPLGATIQEARSLAASRDASGRFVMIGYQWSYSTGIQALKRDILSGRLGRPLRFSGLCCWPRGVSYYRRNGWAGRLRDAASGRWVLDSPANNAMAHSLHNLLYLAGPRTDRSATPRFVTAELARAHDIESCDTVACRVETDEGVEIGFWASHVTEHPIEPCFRLELEDAVVTFGGTDQVIVARLRSGERREYGAPDGTPQFQKLVDAIRCVRDRTPVVCGPEAAASQTLVIDGMHESVPAIPEVPDRLVDRPDGERVVVRGLDGVLMRCYEEGISPSEAGADWLARGARVPLTGYRWYPGGAGRSDL